jgi:hypothetical protein
MSPTPELVLMSITCRFKFVLAIHFLFMVLRPFSSIGSIVELRISAKGNLTLLAVYLVSPPFDENRNG